MKTKVDDAKLMKTLAEAAAARAEARAAWARARDAWDAAMARRTKIRMAAWSKAHVTAQMGSGVPQQ